MALLRALALTAVVGLIAGCSIIPVDVVKGSGDTIIREYDFTGFTKVAASNAFEIEIVRSETYGVVVTVDDNIEAHLDVFRSGDTLHIGLKPIMTIGRVTLEARVHMPSLTGLELSGATRATVSGFSSGEDLDAEVSGASSLRGEIDCGDARLEASGASTIELEGRCEALDVDASGASSVGLGDFTSADTNVVASGASRVTVNVSGQLAADASGASTVRYLGSPESVTSDTSGASTVERQ